ncbi:MAG: hypothetical protein FJ147_16825 [Deltaproteobacteria bacterium]|nr:hypothetical protein [Deltaproteobacteria bacterium]
MASLSLPAGFVEQRAGHTVWWVKEEWGERLLTLTFPHDQAPEPQSAIRNPQSTIATQAGRGTIHRITLASGESIIVRPYRRGGFIRHFIYDLYWDRPFRPFAELSCMEQARQRGVPTVEVLGAQVERTVGPFYRGFLITRQAIGFHNLWDWLHVESTADLRHTVLSIVAQAIATMHQAGIAHADLNPTNILISLEHDPPQAQLLDFDRARIFPRPVPASSREANLSRFQRFFRKYDTLAEWLPSTDFAYFRQRYEITFELRR